MPSRLQSLAEMAYEFIASMLRDAAGTQGMRFFPLVFSLFMFVLVANLFGLFPYFFTVTSHIIVTFALAILVIGTVIVYGFMKHGCGFLKLFVPHGIPVILLPLVVADRDHFVPVAADQPFRPSLRQHAGRPHHAESVLRASSTSLSAFGFVGVAGAVLPLGHDRRASRRLNSWSPSCRPMSSRC